MLTSALRRLPTADTLPSPRLAREEEIHGPVAAARSSAERSRASTSASRERARDLAPASLRSRQESPPARAVPSIDRSAGPGCSHGSQGRDGLTTGVPATERSRTTGPPMAAIRRSTCGVAEAPLGDEAVGRRPAVQRAARLAVDVLFVLLDDDAELGEVQVGVSGLERIVGPLDEVDPHVERGLPLRQLQRARRARRRASPAPRPACATTASAGRP